MTDVILQLRELIGEAPAGYEWLEYLVAAVVVLFLLNCCVSFVAGLFKWIGSGFRD